MQFMGDDFADTVTEWQGEADPKRIQDVAVKLAGMTYSAALASTASMLKAAAAASASVMNSTGTADQMKQGMRTCIINAAVILTGFLASQGISSVAEFESKHPADVAKLSAPFNEIVARARPIVTGVDIRAGWTTEQYETEGAASRVAAASAPVPAGKGIGTLAAVGLAAVAAFFAFR